jgi:hypothetical protein
MHHDIEPWRTVIRQARILPTRKDEMITEILMADKSVNEGPLDVSHATDCGRYPVTDEFVTHSIVPRLEAYAREVFGVEQPSLNWTAWVRQSNDGEGHHLHEHAGAGISAVYYLEGTLGGLVLQDPRTNAGRGYLSEIRRRCFDLCRIKPEPGLLVIFPSFVYHYVQSHPPGLRIAIPIDAFVDAK